MQSDKRFVQIKVEADQLMRVAQFEAAEGLYWQAWESYCDARKAANAVGAVEEFDDETPADDAFWLLISGANAQFSMGDFEGCIDTLVTAFNLFKDVGLVVGNPFFHLRLGQASLEVDPSSISDNSSMATDNLARALVCGGTEIFSGENPIYLSKITAILRPPAGHTRWDDVTDYGCSTEKLGEASGFLSELLAEKYGGVLPGSQGAA